MPELVENIPRIAVIDEDPTNLQIIKFILLEENMTCELSLFESGREAIDHLSANPADLILLDLMNPRDRGIAILRELKSLPELQHTPVIVLSSGAEAKYQIAAFKNGAVDFINKPIHAPVLTYRVQRVLQMRQLQNELQHRNERLEITNRQLDELLSVVSHDLLAPLSSIEIICQLLTDCIVNGESSPVSPDTLVTRIVNQSQMARRLAKNLLNMNKIEEGVLVSSPTFYNIADLLRNCTDDVLAIMQARNLDFELQAPDASYLAFGDRDLISQAIRNLLGNALKFAHSRIEVRGAIIPSKKKSRQHLVITVYDDGPGVPEEERDTIFQKFATSDRQAGGSGLGLFIARKMIELQGGHTALDPTPKIGVQFSITLPFVYQMAHFPDLSDVAEAETLIISAQKSTGQTIEGILIEGGMINVLVEPAGDSAKEALNRPSDIAILDMQHADFNWVSLIKAINRSNGPRHWIFVTHEADHRAVHELMEKPYHALMAPLDPLNLLQIVYDLLTDQSAARDFTGTSANSNVT